MSALPKGPELLEIARGLRTRIAAERDRIEAGRRLPDNLARELAKAGFFRIFLPATYGGLDLSPVDGLQVFEELARADASVAWCVWNGNTHWTAAQLSPAAARTIHADSDVITANSTRSSGQAHVVSGGYRVSGRWSLVSGCELAAWMILLCVVHADGKPCRTDAGTSEIRFMLLPANACEIIDTWTVGGLRGTGSHDVAVRDVFVAENFGSGLFDPHVLPDPRYRLPPFSRVIPGLGAMALGIARTAIESFCEIAGGKTPERTTQMLRHNHGAQVRLSQAESLVGAARLFLYDSVDRLWRSLLSTGEVAMHDRAHARLAASHAVASAVQAVDLLYVGAGANALYAQYPLERAFRDVHAITLHIGVHPRVMESTGQVLLGLEPDTPML
ncbi:MAG TPA: acyl-CoA dehydrogenase family protein [Acetobacteraceae bacterium]|nr:acyl-CoA dehydrogenase family protein [Acetobacteraceae bacterium]